jgi:hypothetical protein
VLAALTIFFQLAYSYFVVLARTRVVFTVQFGWLVALLPALIVGARLDGILGVAVGETAVAGCVILPWYLQELRRAGIPRRVLGSHLWLPLAGAAVAGLAAVGAARVLPNDLAALAVSGMVGLAIVGLLVFRMRAALTRLRQSRAETAAPKVPAVASSTLVTSAAVNAGTGPLYAPGTMTQDRPGPRPQTASLAERRSDETYPPALTRDLLPPWPAYGDATGPLPIFDYVVKRRFPHRGNHAAPLGRQPATDMRPGDQDSGPAGELGPGGWRGAR